MTAHAAAAIPARAHHSSVREGGSTPNVIAVTGSDNGLWVNESGWWLPLGGYLIAAPAVASIPDPDGTDPGQPIFVAVGTDHRLYVRDLSQGWQGLTTGAYCINNPAAVVTSAHAAGSYILTVACEGADTALYYGQEQVGYGSLPSTLPWPMQSLGGGLAAGPAVAPVNPLGAGSVAAEMTFFVIGYDQHVYTRTLVSGWQQMPWECIDHPAASTSLSSVGYPYPPQITVFGCQGMDRELWVSTNAGSGWTAAQPLGGVLIDGPGVATGPEWATFAAEGTTQGAYQNTISYGGNVLGWSGLGGVLQYGAAAAALLYLNANP
jgi:hypothetical protein